MKNLIYLLFFTPLIVVSQNDLQFWQGSGGSTNDGLDFQYINPDFNSPWLGKGSDIENQLSFLPLEIDVLRYNVKANQWCLSAKVVITTSSAVMDVDINSGTIQATLTNPGKGWYTRNGAAVANNNTNTVITLTNQWQEWFSGSNRMRNNNSNNDFARISYKLINPWLTMPTSTVNYEVLYKIETGSFCNN